jgi:hypothetical protein
MTPSGSRAAIPERHDCSAHGSDAYAAAMGDRSLLPASAFRPAVGVRTLYHHYELNYTPPKTERGRGLARR